MDLLYNLHKYNTLNVDILVHFLYILVLISFFHKMVLPHHYNLKLFCNILDFLHRTATIFI